MLLFVMAGVMGVGGSRVGIVCPMGFMELLGAMLALEFVAFAGNGDGASGCQRHEEKFHEAPSITAWA